jgi:predicted Na+-dependent transporter
MVLIAMNGKFLTIVGNHRIYIIVVSAIVSGFAFPWLGIYGSYIIPALILMMLYINFCDVKLNLKRTIRPVLLLPLAMTAVVMPLAAFFLTEGLFSEEYRIGLVLVAAAPTGIMTLVLSRFIRNPDMDLVFGNFMLSTFGAVVYLPILLGYLPYKYQHPNIRNFLLHTSFLVIIPYIVSRITVRILNDSAMKGFSRISKKLTWAIVFGIISVSVSKASKDVNFDMSLIGLFTVVFLIYSLAGGIVYMISQYIGHTENAATLAFISSSRNVQLTLAIAILNFPAITAVPIVFGIVAHHITNAFWLWVLRPVKS